MEFSDLKQGMLVKLRFSDELHQVVIEKRGNEERIIIEKVFNTKVFVTDYNENLSNCCNSNKDIMKVYSSYILSANENTYSANNRELLWERVELSDEDKNTLKAIKVVFPNHRYIARDYDNYLYIYENKPIRVLMDDDGFYDEWSWQLNIDVTWGTVYELDNSILKFIKVDDEEPFDLETI